LHADDVGDMVIVVLVVVVYGSNIHMKKTNGNGGLMMLDNSTSAWNC